MRVAIRTLATMMIAFAMHHGVPAVALAAGGHGDDGHAAQPADNGHGDAGDDGEAGDGEHAVRRVLSYEKLPDDKNQPWQLVRKLQLLQDGIVDGRESRLDEYRFEINRIARILKDSNPQVWQHQRNLDAAAMFLLFGGDAEVGKIALSSTHLPEIDSGPLKAALDYREKNFLEASEYFLGYDVSNLPPSMRGQFTFIAAVIFGNSNAESSEKLFEEAVALSPGTLVEEAALRRLTMIAGKHHDAEKLSTLARQYKQRFSASPYYGDFVRNFYQAGIMLPEREFDKVETMLQSVIDQLPPQRRLDIMTSAAEKAVGMGRLALASWAAEGALPLARDNSSRQHRLKLYLAAVKLPYAESFKESRALLEQIQRDRLDQEHRQLFDALNYLVAGLTDPGPMDSGGMTNLPVVNAKESVRQGSGGRPATTSYPEEARDTLKKMDALFSEIEGLE